MTKRCIGHHRPAAGLALLLAVAGCGGSPAGLGSGEISLRFLDGPADHVAGGPIPTFRVWILNAFLRRATEIQSGSMTFDLLGPSGESLNPEFATVPLVFGQATVESSITLPPASGYTVRARFKGTTATSPPFAVVTAPDVVRATNAPAGEVGWLVDGANNIGRLQDITVKTGSAAAPVGVMNSGADTHLIATFAPDRRPELVPCSWTSGVDTFSVALQDPVSIPLTVWIVVGDFATGKTGVEQALASLNQAWRRERFGVVVSDVELMDATALSDDFGLFAIGLGAPFGPLADGVGRAAGRFNLYVVSQIREGGEDLNGFSETFGTALAVTSGGVTSFGARLLGHEFGHNFGLRDIADDLVGFAVDGNMMKSGLSTTTLTEGQTFRAHFDRFSPLRAFRTGDTFDPVTCELVEATTFCPGLDLRIWSEADPATTATPRAPRAVGPGASP